MSSKETSIHIDRLKSGEEEAINCLISPKFLELENDTDLGCTQPIQVSGLAYIAGDYLIVELEAEAQFTARCAVCSEPFSLDVTLSDWRFEKPLEEIRGGVWDFQEALREELLVQIPLFPQCGAGQCKHRNEVSKFYSKPKEDVNEEGVFRPFQDLFE